MARFVVIDPILKNGIRYEAGSTIELTPEEAAECRLYKSIGAELDPPPGEVSPSEDPKPSKQAK